MASRAKTRHISRRRPLASAPRTAPAASPPSDRLTIARIVKTQGRHGELLAELYTDSVARFDGLERVILWRDVGNEREFSLRGHWPHKQRVVLSLAGIDDISSAEPWIGAEVQLPAAQRLSPPAGRHFISELQECVVYVSGRALGPIVEVEESSAGTLLHVRGSTGDEILIPLAQEYLLNVDIAAKRIDMALPEGLIELNAPSRPGLPKA